MTELLVIAGILYLPIGFGLAVFFNRFTIFDVVVVDDLPSAALFTFLWPVALGVVVVSLCGCLLAGVFTTIWNSVAK